MQLPKVARERLAFLLLFWRSQFKSRLRDRQNRIRFLVVFFSLSRQTKIINLLSLVHFSIVVGVTLGYRNTGPEKVGVTYTDTVYYIFVKCILTDVTRKDVVKLVYDTFT